MENSILFEDKTDWYRLKTHEDYDSHVYEGDDNVCWNKAKVDTFWSVFNKYSDLPSSDYKKIIFPLLPNDSTFFGMEHERKSHVFTDCEFLGRMWIRNMQFDQGFYFRKCKFHGQFGFAHCVFEELSIVDSTMYKDSAFYNSVFHSNCHFDYLRIEKTLGFYDNTFEADVEFFGHSFNGELNFNSSVQGILSFSTPIRKKPITPLNLSNVTIQEFVDGQLMISDFEANFIIRNSSLNVNSEFRKIQLARLFISNSLVEESSFVDCTTHNKKGRLELGRPQGFNDEQQANNYRQFKRIYKNELNWPYFGDAYFEEMKLMRQHTGQLVLTGPKRFSNLINWFIRGFYELSSGYLQSLGQPLFCLLVLIVVIAAIISINESPVIAIKQSIGAAFPLVARIDSQSPYFFMLAFERVVSVILIAFFVLATRGKLRS